MMRTQITHKARLDIKMVIDTQHRENYAAHDWSGEGEAPQAWKYKGGDTYVVEHIHDHTVCADMLVELKPLIEHFDDYFEEYILDWKIVGDSEPVCEKWESPVVLRKVDSGDWVALHIQEHQRGFSVASYRLGEAGEQVDRVYTQQLYKADEYRG